MKGQGGGDGRAGAMAGDVASAGRDQRGAVLVITLLVMLALTILGVAGLRTTAVELHIARNEREMRETFYLAEGAAIEGVQRLVQGMAEDLGEQVLSWHHPRDAVTGDGLGFRSAAHWRTDPGQAPNCLDRPVEGDSFIAAVEWQVAPGGSLAVTGSRLYLNRVYGLSRRHGADHVVEIGCYLRY